MSAIRVQPSEAEALEGGDDRIRWLPLDKGILNRPG